MATNINTDEDVIPKNVYVKERATYDAMLAAGQITRGNIYYIEDTGEILVFDGVFGGGKGVDTEILEGCMPLSRDFSDDFNNDFAR